MRNILIIGGSSSIGDSVEQAFMNHGDNVLSTYFSSPGKKENTNIKYIKLVYFVNTKNTFNWS